MTVESPELRVRSDGEYSSVTFKSSSESNFRELDDAFLQTQTRIWLGEVLQIRFDEETSISDILADGELLFELSEALSKMQPTLYVDPTQSKSNEWKIFASSKSTWRYMPYYNVGSFVKMCKNLGLDDIDLFSPSDVVDKRNTRKVCMCIRSLSKKARSKDLNVPDFDSVTCTLSMPTNMVECIRKSLETSQCSSSQSVGQDPEKTSRVRYWKMMSNSASSVSNGSSDISDDAESRFMANEAHGPSNYADDVVSLNTVCLEVDSDNCSALQLNVKHLESEEDDLCEYLSPSNAESVGSPCSQYFSDQEISMPSVNCLGSSVGGDVELFGEAKPGYQNRDLSHIPIGLKDSHVEGGHNSNGQESRDIGNHSDALANGDPVDKDNRLWFSRKDTDTVCSTSNEKCSQQFENLTHLSEIKCAKSSCNDIERVSCRNSTSVEERETEGACEYVSEQDFGSSVSGILMSSLEDAQVTISTARWELVIDEASCDDKVKNESTSDELLQQSYPSIQAEISEFSSSTDDNNAGNSDCGSLINYSTSGNFPGQMVEKLPGRVDCNVHNFKCSNPLVVKSNGFENHLTPSKSFAEEGFTGSDVTIVSPENGCWFIDSDKEVFCTVITSDHTEELFRSDFMDGVASNSMENPHTLPAIVLYRDNLESSEKDSQHTKVESEVLKVLDSSKNVKSIDDDDDDNDAIVTRNNSTSLDDPQLGAELPGCVEYATEKHQPFAENFEKGNSEYVKQEDDRKEMPQSKPQRKLLKTVVKGTALLGIAVFLLQLRKNRQENLSIDRKPISETLTRKAPKPSSQKGQKGGNTSSVYPAEKLNFGF